MRYSEAGTKLPFARGQQHQQIVASSKHALAAPIARRRGLSNDCGGRVAPARFYRSVGNDIESYRCLQSRGRFSQSSLSLCKQCSSADRSAGFYRHSNEDLQEPEPFPAIHFAFSPTRTHFIDMCSTAARYLVAGTDLFNFAAMRSMDVLASIRDLRRASSSGVHLLFALFTFLAQS
jgi:hypothetical protein